MQHQRCQQCERQGTPQGQAQRRPIGAVHIAGSLSEWSVEDFRRRFAPLAIEAARAVSG